MADTTNIVSWQLTCVAVHERLSSQRYTTADKRKLKPVIENWHHGIPILGGEWDGGAGGQQVRFIQVAGLGNVKSGGEICGQRSIGAGVL